MRALLIMPNFFEYPQAISEELTRMGYIVDYFDDRPSTNGIIKAIIRIKKELISVYIKKYFEKMMETVRQNCYDVVLLISGQSLSFSEEMILEIRECQRDALFVLYQWDSEKNFPYIKRMQKYFDKCYSFDRKDVDAEESLRFLPLFYTRKYEMIAKKQKSEFQYDFCFVGTAHPKKYRFINRISKQLGETYQKQFIYYFLPSKLVYFYRKFKDPEFKYAKIDEFHFIPLRGAEIDDLLINSRCILDSAQDGQIGLTIRVLEALGARKKLITTNTDIINYDFYREENIYVYNGFIDLNAKFFKKPYTEIDVDVYRKYSLNSWLNELVKR